MMEKTKRFVNQIAYTPTHNLSKLSLLQRCLVPFLSSASSLYKLALSLRYHLYYLGFFKQHRLPVPVISVGNLTWGGNGKTPMVEFLALWFAKTGIPPLILTRGYAGGDEATMLQRHLSATSGKIGVGANRFTTAAHFFKLHGYLNSQSNGWVERLRTNQKTELSSNSDKIGVVILDDGMQHWSLFRDVEVVMVNGMKPWGNSQLVPLGPLREPLAALKRADAVVIHHADLVSGRELRQIEFLIHEVKDDIPIFFSSFSPSSFFEVGNCHSKVALSVIHNRLVLCVSAIGSPDAFVQGIKKLRPLHVDRLDFSDHHLFQAKDVEMIKGRLRELQHEFHVKPVVVVTEKDYDRDPVILKNLSPFEVLVLCSHLQLLPHTTSPGEQSQKLLKQLLLSKILQALFGTQLITNKVAMRELHVVTCCNNGWMKRTHQSLSCGRLFTNGCKCNPLLRTKQSI